METGLNASACVGKQPIMVATASTEHSYWLASAKNALAFLAVFVYATHSTQAIAFEWKPSFRSRKAPTKPGIKVARRDFKSPSNHATLV